MGRLNVQVDQFILLRLSLAAPIAASEKPLSSTSRGSFPCLPTASAGRGQLLTRRDYLVKMVFVDGIIKKKKFPQPMVAGEKFAPFMAGLLLSPGFKIS